MTWTIRHLMRAGFMVIALSLTGCSDNTTIPELEDLNSVNELTQRRDIAQQRETLGVAKSKYLQLQQEGQRTRAALEELRGLHQRWKQEIPGLLQNEDGRYIAASQQDVSTFRSHVDTLVTLPDSTLDSMAAELDALLAPVESALNDKTVVTMPDERLSTQLSALSARLDEALASYRLASSSIQSVAANAKTRGELGSKSLEEAVEEVIQSEAESRSARIEAARKAADDEVTKMLAQTTQELVRAKGEKENGAMKAEIDLLDSQTREAALVAKATNPDTLARLKPFITKTTTRYESTGPGDHRWLEKQMEEAPFSYSALSRSGGLEPTTKGVETLHFLATFHMNNRPAWPSSNSPKDWEWVKENQELLRELGPTLVSLGHLAP